jgi:hypothetical protein
MERQSGTLHSTTLSLTSSQATSISGDHVADLPKNSRTVKPGVIRCVFSNKSPRIATAFGRPHVQASAKRNDLPDMVAVVDDGLPKHGMRRVGLLSVGGSCHLN